MQYFTVLPLEMVVEVVWRYAVLVQCTAGLLHLSCRLVELHIMPTVLHKWFSCGEDTKMWHNNCLKTKHRVIQFHFLLICSFCHVCNEVPLCILEFLFISVDSLKYELVSSVNTDSISIIKCIGRLKMHVPLRINVSAITCAIHNLIRISNTINVIHRKLLTNH